MFKAEGRHVHRAQLFKSTSGGRIRGRCVQRNRIVDHRIIFFLRRNVFDMDLKRRRHLRVLVVLIAEDLYLTVPVDGQLQHLLVAYAI